MLVAAYATTGVTQHALSAPAPSVSNRQGSLQILECPGKSNFPGLESLGITPMFWKVVAVRIAACDKFFDDLSPNDYPYSEEFWSDPVFSQICEPLRYSVPRAID